MHTRTKRTKNNNKEIEDNNKEKEDNKYNKYNKYNAMRNGAIIKYNPNNNNGATDQPRRHRPATTKIKQQINLILLKASAPLEKRKTINTMLSSVVGF